MCVNRRHGGTIGRHSLSHALWACQLPQRGSRGWAVPFNVLPGKRNETQKFLHFTIQRGTLPQSASLPAPSEREPGAAVPFNVPPGKRNETQKFLHSAIHRGTLPQSASLTAPSGREPGLGAYHSTCRSESARLRAIFIAPTKLRILNRSKTSGFCRGNDTGWGRAPTYGYKLKA